MIYVNLFNENLNIKSYLADLKRIDEKNAKVIIRCENVEQAKMISEMEEILNQCINVAEHKMDLINEKDIELLLTFH